MALQGAESGSQSTEEIASSHLCCASQDIRPRCHSALPAVVVASRGASVLSRRCTLKGQVSSLTSKCCCTNSCECSPETCSMLCAYNFAANAYLSSFFVCLLSSASTCLLFVMLTNRNACKVCSPHVGCAQMHVMQGLCGGHAGLASCALPCTCTSRQQVSHLRKMASRQAQAVLKPWLKPP